MKLDYLHTDQKLVIDIKRCFVIWELRYHRTYHADRFITDRVMEEYRIIKWQNNLAVL